MKINEWFDNCLKTCPWHFFANLNKACEMEWLCNDTSFCLTWKHACQMAEKEKWGKQMIKWRT